MLKACVKMVCNLIKFTPLHRDPSVLLFILQVPVSATSLIGAVTLDFSLVDTIARRRGIRDFCILDSRISAWGVGDFLGRGTA